jgi:membrane protein involved in colicin uptake
MKADNAYAYADANAYANANANANANAYAYADAYAYANAYPKKKSAELKAALFDAGLRYLDDILPPADIPSGEVLARAAHLCEMAP